MARKAEARDDGGGPVVTKQWRTGMHAVNAFSRLCIDQGWVFTETPQQTDFGKDGYVDIAVDGALTGYCVAVQIKGGPSFRTRDGYKIPTTAKLHNYWQFSTTPVFGVVWDEAEDAIYWTNATGQLWREDIKTIKIPKANRFPDTGLEFMQAAFHASVGSEVAAALGADDEDRQISAIWDIRALGRHDHRHLVLLRRVMFGLQPRALDFSIVTLNDYSLNMDLIKTSESVAIGAKVRPSYRWTVDEAVALLDRSHDDGNGYFGRGSWGQAIYYVLMGDDMHGFFELVRRAAQRAAQEGRTNAASMGLILLTAWAEEDGRSVVEAFVAEYPEMLSSEIVTGLIADLDAYGSVSLQAGQVAVTDDCSGVAGHLLPVRDREQVCADPVWRTTALRRSRGRVHDTAAVPGSLQRCPASRLGGALVGR